MSRVLRADVTDAEYKRLRQIAAGRDQSVMQLVTVALQTAPATRKAFTPDDRKAARK